MTVEPIDSGCWLAATRGNVAERKWLWYCSAILSLELEVTNGVFIRSDEDGDYERNRGKCVGFKIVIEYTSREFVGKRPAISALSFPRTEQRR